MQNKAAVACQRKGKGGVFKEMANIWWGKWDPRT